MAITGQRSWRPEFAERIVELGAQGKSITQIAAALDVSRTTIFNWTTEDHPSFEQDALNAIERAKELSEAWWESIGQDNLHDWIDPKGPHKRFNAKVYELNMMNRFGWGKKEKHEVEQVVVNVDGEMAKDAQ